MRAGLAWMTIAGIAGALGIGAAIVACTVVNDEVVPQAVTTFPALLSLQTGAAVCRWVTQCSELGPSIVDSLLLPLPPASIENFSACVDILSGPFPNPLLPSGSRAKTLSCMASATSCTDALDCVPTELLAAGDPRCQGQPSDDDAGVFCSDSKSAVFCTNDPANGFVPEVQHCSSPVYGSGASCGVGACATKESCSVGSSCKGDIEVTCFNGTNPNATSGDGDFSFLYDCSVGGQTCALTPDGMGGMVPTCVNSTQNSGSSFTNGVSCVGPVVLLSAANSEVGFPCSNITGATCSEDPTARCVVPNAKCSPYDGDTVNVCTGNTISLCVGGQITRFDCSSINLSCSGDSSGKHANCQ